MFIVIIIFIVIIVLHFSFWSAILCLVFRNSTHIKSFFFDKIYYVLIAVSVSTCVPLTKLG
jgi:hypothetical protein